MDNMAGLCANCRAPSRVKQVFKLGPRVPRWYPESALQTARPTMVVVHCGRRACIEAIKRWAEGRK